MLKKHEDTPGSRHHLQVVLKGLITEKINDNKQYDGYNIVH